jgi:PAS domain S-box-containing protein
MHSALIIEDDPITLYVYKSHLEKAGFDVKIANDGEAAFYILQKTPPDAILLDLMLPRINGVEILKTIRAHKDFEAIPVFVFTNLHTSTLAKEAAKAGANRVFDKATTVPAEIIEAIREAVSHRPAPLVQERVSSLSPTEAGGLSQPVLESCPEIEPELLRAFINKVHETFMALRKILQKLSKAEDTPERIAQLSELSEKVHAVTSVGASAELHGLSKMGAALEAFVRQLSEDSKQINVSTLRTVSHAIDFLDVLFKRGIRDDSSESMPISILVVDDDRISRLAITSALARAKLKLLDVESPHLALRLLKENPFDLIFLDVTMPEMNGFELCIELRKLPHHKTTPVVFVTSLTDFESRSRSTLSGGNDLITKPFLFSELAVKTLMYALKGRFAQTGSGSSKTSFTHKTAAERPANPPLQIEVASNPQPALGTSAQKAESQTSEPSSRLAASSLSISGVITMDERGVIKSLNSAADTLFGYETSEAVGLPITCLIPDAHQTNKNRILVGQLIRGKEKVLKSVTHFVGERKDKSTFFLSVSLSEITLVSRRMFTCIVRDLSEPAKAKHTAQPIAIEAQATRPTEVNQSNETGIKTATPPPIDTARTVISGADQQTQAELLTDSEHAAEGAQLVPAEKDLQILQRTEELKDARAELEKESAECRQLAARSQGVADIQTGLQSNEIVAAQAAWRAETAAREKLAAQTKELCSSQTARVLDLEQRKQFEDRLHQNQKELEAQSQMQDDALKTQEEARKENQERQRLEALIKESIVSQAALNQELADCRKIEEAWRAKYEELERQFKDQSLQLAGAKSTLEQEIAKHQQLESDMEKPLSAHAGVPRELIDRQKIEAELPQRQEDLEASVADQSRKLAEVQAEYQQESTQRQRLETRTRELSANFLEQSKILSEAQAQLENVMSHRQKFEEDASTMASKLKSIEEELSDRDIVEGNLRRAKEELEAHARGEAPKFAQLETQLLKANAERQRVEAHATELFKTQIESAQELSRRKQTEETLRRTHTELEGRVGHQTAELERVRALLEKEVADRKKLEAQAVELARVHASLTQEVSDRVLPEQALRTANSELQDRLKESAHELSKITAQLQREEVAHQQIIEQSAELSRSRAELNQRLADRRQAEETLRCTRDELEVRVQHQAKELARVETELENEICERQKVTVSGVETADGHAALVDELNERKQLELDLRLAKEQLASKLESQNTRLTQLQAKLLAEVSERQRLETHASDLGAAHVELGQQLTQKTETQAALRQAYVELGTAAEERLGRLCQTQAHLENTLTERDQAVGQASELAQKKALVQEQLTERQKVEDSLRKTQKELEGRIETQAADLARTEAERKNQVSHREQLEQRAAELAKVQIGLKQQLSQRTKTEEALRRAYAELGKAAQDRAHELKATRAQLQKEITQREHVEMEAARFAATQAAFEKELNARQQAEQTLQRSQQELGSIIEN